MKTNVTYDVDTSFKDSKKFTIEASAKAFSILSGSVYKNPMRAIVRELSANAWDAHFKKGNTHVPFEITIPSALAPELQVKDYGIGLSPEAVMNLYTVYFGSDKTLTNELIGGLGLGSKTPFSYTDSFTVVSRWNKAIYTFACFLGKDKMPCINQVSAVNNPDPRDTGLTVIIPCSDKDAVIKELDAVMWFPTQPKVFGADLPKRTVRYESDDFILADPHQGSQYFYRQCVYVLMGHILYNVGQCTAGRSFTYDYYFKADIGDFEPSASRESLHDVNADHFKDKMNEADREYVQEIGKILDNTQLTYPEQMCLAYDNWKVLRKHPKIGVIDELIADIAKTYDYTLRGYRKYRVNITTCKGLLTNDAFVKSMMQKNAERLFIYPKGKKNVRHTKIVETHFPGQHSIINSISVPEKDIPALQKDLKKVFPPHKIKLWTDYPIAAPVKTKKTKSSTCPGRATTPQPMSAQYQDITLNGVDYPYKDALKLDTSETLAVYYDRRYGTYSQERTTKAICKHLDIKNYLFVPNTELLMSRFRDKKYFLAMYAWFQGRKYYRVLQYDYSMLKYKINCRFGVTISVVQRSDSKHQSIIQLKNILTELEEFALISTQLQKCSDSHISWKRQVHERLDEPYFRRLAFLLAKLEARYPNLDKYPDRANYHTQRLFYRCLTKNISQSDYMRYQDEHR